MRESQGRPDRFWMIFGVIALAAVLVILPIAICAGLLLPAIARARAAAQQAVNAEAEARLAAEREAQAARQAADAAEPDAPPPAAP